jgi:hypothetical protein
VRRWVIAHGIIDFAGTVIGVTRVNEEARTVKHKMLVKVYKKHEISDALDGSENGVMFEKSESADTNSSNDESDFKGIL